MASKSTKKKRSTRQKKKKVNEQSFVRDEILVWLTLAVSIFMVISNFGSGGAVGDVLADVLMDIFGLIAYIIPFVLFGIVSFLISNKGKQIAYRKSIACVVLTIFVCTFVELLDGWGGQVGYKIVRILTPAIGVAGAYIITMVAMIICLVLITGKSALGGVKTQSSKAYDKAKKDAQRRREAAAEARKQREAEAARQEQKQAKEQAKEKTTARKGKRRLDQHVEGVSFDTTLTEPAKEAAVPKDVAASTMEPVREEPQFVIHRGAVEDPFLDSGETVSQKDVQNVQSPVEETVEIQEEKTERKRRNPKLDAKESAKEVAGVAAAVAASEAQPKKEYKKPPLSLLKRGKRAGGDSDAHLRETAMKLQQTLETFGVKVTVTNVSCGPSVTRYELQPELGVKVGKIVSLADDIKLNLAATDIRIEAPIPGKAAVGIEVPNKENSIVMLRDLLETSEFQNSASKLSFAAGKDIGGKVVVTDIAKMPHVLIAGATGSGKSVCINTLIMSILYKASPEEVKLIMIDPKVVELSVYNGIPHLMIPVVTDPKKAAGALNWGVAEMSRRYQEFAKYGVRDMQGYNEAVEGMPEIDGKKPKKMYQLVIIVDELADLMMVAPGDVEGAICRLAQLARAAGIHLVIATQRPSVNVITGLIKANMPSRIAFSVTSSVDSRTIIDMGGAEKLLGKGDMLFYPSGYPKPARVQGAFVTDKEVENVVEYLKNNHETTVYDEEIVNQLNTGSVEIATPASEGNERDAYFEDAGRLIIEKEKASIGMLQRTFKIGFNRAARIMDQLCEAGVVGGEEGTKPRKVLMSQEEFEQYLNESI